MKVVYVPTQHILTATNSHIVLDVCDIGRVLVSGDSRLIFTATHTTAMLLFTLATILAAASAHLCTLNPLQRGASNINGFINTAFAQECYLYTGMRIASAWLYVVHCRYMHRTF